jgi:prolyl 4-hydroxylase
MTALLSFISAILLLAGTATHVNAQGDPSTQKALSSELTCIHPPFKIHLFSKSPLVIYIANFITPEERAHLQDLA